MNARVGGKANDRPSSFFGFSLCTPGLSQPRGGEGEKEVSGTLSIGSRKNYKMNEKKKKRETGTPPPFLLQEEGGRLKSSDDRQEINRIFSFYYLFMNILLFYFK